jgi:DNA-binding SARP family transcriptional activator
VHPPSAIPTSCRAVRRARAILGCLCLAGDAPIERSRLAACCGTGFPTFQARASLRQAFRELTLAFGPLAGELLAIDRNTIRFNTGACWIDAVALLSEEPGADTVRSELAELCKGELLDDLDGMSTAFDRWLLTERTRFAEGLRNLLASRLEAVRDGQHAFERTRGDRAPADRVRSDP